MRRSFNQFVNVRMAVRNAAGRDAGAVRYDQRRSETVFWSAGSVRDHDARRWAIQGENTGSGAADPGNLVVVDGADSCVTIAELADPNARSADRRPPRKGTPGADKSSAVGAAAPRAAPNPLGLRVIHR
jgi:hypothetical protein